MTSYQYKNEAITITLGQVGHGRTFVPVGVFTEMTNYLENPEKSAGRQYNMLLSTSLYKYEIHVDSIRNVKLVRKMQHKTGVKMHNEKLVQKCTKQNNGPDTGRFS
uniref:Uncharacterized protein n=1 Tax=Romanomermis culicivorax TaxID=13658 RepID=A0A915L6T4_ROMCU